ncbi:YqaE/Pmp3 family membrane protein, partial [Paenibacillus larvae]|uniref:YqaE/Pmp3 family membrane protein n=1 Tax=Paenibacillus larvae TaxID=1464 RepID=UPI0022800D5E
DSTYIAIILPPLAVFLSGKPGQGMLSIILTILGWIPGAVHAVIIVKNKKADDEMLKHLKLMNRMNMRQ